MKVRLLIANAYGGAGTARTVINQANALVDSHEVEVVSVLRRRGRTRFPLAPGVRLRGLVDVEDHSGARVLRRLPSLLAHPQDRRYRLFSPATDVALWRYLHSLQDGVVMGTRPALNLAIARWAPPSVIRIAQEHMHLDAHRPRLRAAVATYFPRLDAVATLTAQDATSYRALLGSSTRVVTVPNGVALATTHVSSQDNTAVVAVGRLVEQKGYDRLINAFHAVAATHPQWSLTIFGRGPLRQSLQDQIDRLGLGDQVRLAGFSARVAEELAAASVFALSSRREGLPMAMLEAMGSGLAVVSFDCPTGPRDLIDHGTDGLLVADGDEQALAAALARVLDDESLRRSLGANARRKALGYGTEMLAQRWDDLFQEIGSAREHPAQDDGVHARFRSRHLPLSWVPLPSPVSRS